MKHMWEACKSYFGDGFIPGSSPLRFDVHVCGIERPAAKNDSHHYGVELDEDMLPLFTTLGECRAPSCTCGEMPAVAAHIDEYISAFPGAHPADYSLHTGKKGDQSPDMISVYILRDALSWWAHWHGSLAGHRWKHLYLAISAVLDDIQVPPRHLVDGTWRYLGHSLDDVLRGLRAEGMHPDDVELAKMHLWREAIVQYVEKIDPGLRALLLGKTTLMTQFRVLTANNSGVAAVLTAARGVRTAGVSDKVLESAGMCDALSMDMAKEMLGVLEGEKTETVAGDRQRLKQELRWVYARYLVHLDAQEHGHLLRRYAISGFHFVPMMDRYLERVEMVRWPLPPAMRQMIGSYVNLTAACDGDVYASLRGGTDVTVH